MYKLYFFNQYRQLSTEFLERALLVLPNDRRIRVQRYRHEIDRKNSIVAYLMLQYALRECYGITAFWMKLGEYGKPYLPEHPHIHFNISHCKEGCVVAVADRPVGIDIQEIRPFSWSIAKSVCGQSELDQLKRCADRERYFTKMWTMKESYIKMIGKGISYGLDQVDTIENCTNTTVLKLKNCFASVCISPKQKSF